LKKNEKVCSAFRCLDLISIEQLKKKLIVDIKGKEEVIITNVVNTVSSESIKGTLVVEVLSGDGLAPRDSNGLR
jgi:hypothetical protein